MVVTGDTAIEPNASHDVAPEPSVESIDMAQTTTSLIAMLLICIVIGVAGNSLLGVPGAARVRVVEGYAFANMDGEAIGLSAEKGGPGEGYIIAGAHWRQQGQPWHDDFPTCVQPLVSDQRVRLGFVRARPLGEAPGRSVVVWLECLGS